MLTLQPLNPHPKRNEFKAYGLSVAIAYPSNLDSPGFAEENKTKPKETAEIEGAASLFSPEAAADHLLNGWP